MKLEASDDVQVGVIQINKETLSKRQIRDICQALRHQSLTVLSLRECAIGDDEFRRLAKAVAVCQTIQQLNLNVGVVNSEERVTVLAKYLRKNTSLKSL